jgi:hypothetical protein
MGCYILSATFLRKSRSHTSLDPDGITFWHTSMYSASNIKSRIFSFKLLNPTTIVESQNKSEFSINQIDKLLWVKGSKIISTANLNVDVFDVNGKLLSEKMLVRYQMNLKPHLM